ncbi:hypothetical protein GCM10028820_03460 [Tessaracoccus terricola]
MSQHPHPQPRRSGTRSLWWVVVGVLACVLGGLVAYGLLTSDAEDAPVGPASQSPSVSGTPSPTCCGPEPSPSPSPSPSPTSEDLHPRGLAGSWLDEGYASGATEVSFEGLNARPVGLSADGSVYAFMLDDVLHGISTATGEQVWEFPSYLCSVGTREGVALCSSIEVPQDYFPGKTTAPLVGVDIAAGTVAYEVDAQFLPSDIRMVGSHDELAIYLVADHAASGALFGQIEVLALGPSGEVAWRHSTGIDDVLGQAALVEGGRLALLAGNVLQLIDLADGSMVFQQDSDDAFTDVQWDGFGVYTDGAGTAFFDWEGNELSNPAGGYAVQPFPYVFLGLTPTYPLEMLGIGVEKIPTSVMFSPDGEALLSDIGLQFNNRGEPIPSSNPLSVSPDGSVVAVMDNYDRPTIHRVSDGAVIAEFSTSNYVDTLVVDGYLSIQERSGEGEVGIRILLPKG